MWGIVPAAGRGSRIQPLAFSKELLPVGGAGHPRAVSDYLIERLVAGGATRICIVIAPGKSDILQYYGGSVRSAAVCYAVQPEPDGLCDAIFRALPFVSRDEDVAVGLPDTIWFPADALCRLPGGVLSFLLFPTDYPERFDAVRTAPDGRVLEIRVKQPCSRAQGASSAWIWGAFKMPGSVLHALYDLWRRRDCRDEYIGTLVNAWLAEGGDARAVAAGELYLDVGTMEGYVGAIQMLAGPGRRAAS